jgi:hypothetical protein
MRISNLIIGFPLFVIDTGTSGKGWFYNPGEAEEISLVYAERQTESIQTETFPRQLPIQEDVISTRWVLLSQ